MKSFHRWAIGESGGRSRGEVAKSMYGNKCNKPLVELVEFESALKQPSFFAGRQFGHSWTSRR